MTRLYLLEPEPTPLWAPFAGVRPIAELRAGAWLLRERWEALFGVGAAGLLAPHLDGFVEAGAPPVVPAEDVTGPAVIVRADVLPPRTSHGFPGRRLTTEGTTVAWRLEAGERWPGPDAEGPATELPGRVLEGAWQLVDALEGTLAADCLEFTQTEADPVPPGSIVMGDAELVVCLDAAVEPGVVFDTRRGAVVLAEGVEVRSGTRLEGPVFAGPGTRILGGAIRHASFGPECRVHGEVSTTVMVGYANKSHDGFVGHSVIGPWANLGAGTITSNLKNTYGPVRLAFPGGELDTGRTFLGSLIGDHAKTGIGTLLGTGTVIGAGAHLLGGAAPRWVPPLHWPTGGRLSEEGFLRIAARVLPRRGVAFDAPRERWLRTLHRRLST